MAPGQVSGLGHETRRGKPQVLVHVSTGQGSPFWNSGFLSHSHMEKPTESANTAPASWPRVPCDIVAGERPAAQQSLGVAGEPPAIARGPDLRSSSRRRSSLHFSHDQNIKTQYKNGRNPRTMLQELRRRISAAMYGWDYPISLANLHLPGFWARDSLGISVSVAPHTLHTPYVKANLPG